jgi:hypothetical protein
MRQLARTRRLPTLALIAVLLVLLPHSMQASSAIGGGVTTDDVMSSAVTASGPAFGGTLHGILIEPGGWGAAPIGWEADVRNDGAGQVIVAVVAICAHWPMEYLKGNEAPALSPPPY